jgi:PleD family two-component response regulator
MLQNHSAARLVIIDHDRENPDLLERFLIRTGVRQVRSFRDPRDVYGQLDDLNPDLVFIDLAVPFIDAYTLLAHIRSWAVDTFLPIIVLASGGQPEGLLKALHEGATDFVTKPFNGTEIAVRVRNLLDARSLQKELRSIVPACDVCPILENNLDSVDG